ncbi:MmgE/PrpD family protein [bacterium]|nr:MmgE/PrpD family protein [bacterium]
MLSKHGKSLPKTAEIPIGDIVPECCGAVFVYRGKISPRRRPAPAPTSEASSPSASIVRGKRARCEAASSSTPPSLLCSAALLAKRHFTGPKLILEGPQGLFSAIAPDGSPIEIIFEPNAAPRILDVSFKPWPACRHAHPAIDAALLAKAKLAPNTQIEAVLVESYADALKFCDKAEPRVELEAKFSLQHSVAVALVKNRPILEDFSPPFSHEKVNAMRQRVKLALDAEIDRCYPKQYGARVTIVMSNGDIEMAEVQDAWGDPANPLSIQDLDAKFSALLVKVGVQQNMITMLSQAVKQLPEQKNLIDFSKLLARVQAG